MTYADVESLVVRITDRMGAVKCNTSTNNNNKFTFQNISIIIALTVVPRVAFLRHRPSFNGVFAHMRRPVDTGWLRGHGVFKEPESYQSQISLSREHVDVFRESIIVNVETNIKVIAIKVQEGVGRIFVFELLKRNP